MKTLVVGGSGFIGSYLMNEIEADNLDLKEASTYLVFSTSSEFYIVCLMMCNNDLVGQLSA